MEYHKSISKLDSDKLHIIDEKTSSMSDLSLPYTSRIEIKRSILGRIESVAFYSMSNEHLKTVYYSAYNEISKIEVYKNNKLFIIELYEHGVLTSKTIYANIPIYYSYYFDKLKRLCSLEKNIGDKSVKVEYSYDEIDRVIERRLYVNNLCILNQSYKYDILNQIIKYLDDRQEIIIEKYGKKNELLSYIIYDNLGNTTSVKNYYSSIAYEYSEISQKGNTTKVKDYNYVDIAVLKSPIAGEYDLDILSYQWNLWNGFDSTKNIRKKEEKQALFIAEDAKVLPISMRKLKLYKLVVNS